MNSGPTLTIGSTGADVRRLQTLFVMMKEMEYSDIDGTFGPKTQDAVKSFQQGKEILRPTELWDHRRGTHFRQTRTHLT
jgi:peptidoglycan hydrolase-like protein with peptidoglycan-binding domain